MTKKTLEDGLIVEVYWRDLGVQHDFGVYQCRWVGH